MLNSIKKISILLILLTGQFVLSHAQVTFTIDKPSATYCTGEKVLFTNTTPAGYTSLHWDFGDGYDTYGTNVGHIYLSSGTYQVVLTAIVSGSPIASNPLTITVNLTPSIIILYNSTFQTLTARKSTTPDLVFHWYYKSNEITSEHDSILNATESGSYEVIAESEFGCTDTARYTISPTNNGTTTKDTLKINVLNNVLTPNGDGANDVLYIQDLGEYVGALEIYIYNRWGQLVYSNTNYSNLDGFKGTSKDGKDLDSGTYYYVVKSSGRKGGSGFIDIIK